MSVKCTLKTENNDNNNYNTTRERFQLNKYNKFYLKKTKKKNRITAQALIFTIEDKLTVVCILKSLCNPSFSALYNLSDDKLMTNLTVVSV